MDKGKAFRLSIFAAVLGLAMLLLGGAVGGSRPVEAAAPCGVDNYWYLYGTASWSCDGTALIGQTSSGQSAAVSTTVFQDFQFVATGSTSREAYLIFRMLDEANGYALRVVPAGVPGMEPGVWLIRRSRGADTTLGYAYPPSLPAAGGAFQVQIAGTGALIQITFNGVLMGTYTDSVFATGRVGFGIYGDNALPVYARFWGVNLYAGAVLVASSNLVFCDTGRDKYWDYSCPQQRCDYVFAPYSPYRLPGVYATCAPTVVIIYVDGGDCDYHGGYKGKWQWYENDWKCRYNDDCFDGHGYGKWNYSGYWKCEYYKGHYKVGDRCDDGYGYGKWGYDGYNWKCNYDRKIGDRCDDGHGYGKWGYYGGNWKCDYDRKVGDRCDDGYGYGKWGYYGGNWKCDYAGGHHKDGDDCYDGGNYGKWGYSGGGWKCNYGGGKGGSGPISYDPCKIAYGKCNTGAGMVDFCRDIRRWGRTCDQEYSDVGCQTNVWSRSSYKNDCRPTAN